MNLCTDQLALMLAAPGQLVSVSDVALDPRMSPLAEEARAFTVNHGRAEEIYLLDPDLVLAGEWSDSAVVSMLERLGVRVVRIGAATSLDDVPRALEEVGAHLGQEARAAEIAESYRADLARLRNAANDAGTRPRAAIYYANGYSLGPGTIADGLLRAAGFSNIVAETGMARNGRIAMELLVLAAPDLIVTGETYPGTSQAEAMLSHPAVSSLTSALEPHRSDADWVCGTPYLLRAIRELAEARAQIEGAGQ